MMECVDTNEEVEPEQVEDGVIRCPACGRLIDEETLEDLE